MARLEFEGFVNERVGDPVFVLKVSENHRKKNDQGGFDNAGRTFFDVKVGRDSGIDLGQVPVDARVKVVGRQVTEVREHQGKKFYTLTVWADRIEPAQSQDARQNASQGGFGGGSGASAGSWSPSAGNGAQNAFGGGAGFDDEQPF